MTTTSAERQPNQIGDGLSMGRGPAVTARRHQGKGLGTET